MGVIFCRLLEVFCRQSYNLHKRRVVFISFLLSVCVLYHFLALLQYLEFMARIPRLITSSSLIPGAELTYTVRRGKAVSPPQPLRVQVGWSSSKFSSCRPAPFLVFQVRCQVFLVLFPSTPVGTSRLVSSPAWDV